MWVNLNTRSNSTNSTTNVTTLYPVTLLYERPKDVWTSSIPAAKSKLPTLKLKPSNSMTLKQAKHTMAHDLVVEYVHDNEVVKGKKFQVWG
jgi:hypothetical protein